MIGLGLLGDVIDAAAYFCAQRRARLRRVRVTEAAELMRRHGQPRATVADWKLTQAEAERLTRYALGHRNNCSVHCLPSCSYPKCVEGS